MREDNTESPLVNPNITHPTESRLRVHFYHLNSLSPWWLRWFWRPKPLYGHCSVEWGPFVHNMTLREGAGLHHAVEYHRENPPDLTIKTSFKISFAEISQLVWQFERDKVQRWRVFLWWSGLRRRRVPMSCAALVSAWINLSFENPDTDRLRVGTPDELYNALRGMSNAR